MDILVVFLFSISHLTAAVRYPIDNPTSRGQSIRGTTTGPFSWDPLSEILCVNSIDSIFQPHSRVPTKFLPPDQVSEDGRSQSSFKDIYGPNLRSLCAKWTFGGSNRAWNAGGYCHFGADPPTVVFERLPPDGENMGSLVEDIFRICQNSCRCVSKDAGAPMGISETRAAVEEAEAAALTEVWHEGAHSVFDPLPSRAELCDSARPREPDFKYATVYFFPETFARIIRETALIPAPNLVTTMWIEPNSNAWRPNCPGTFSGADFGFEGATAQQMCAAEFFGGSERGNAGLVCVFTRNLGDEGLTKLLEYAPGTTLLGKAIIGEVKNDISWHPAYTLARKLYWPPSIYTETYSTCLDVCECNVGDAGFIQENSRDSIRNRPLIQIGILEKLRQQTEDASRTAPPAKRRKHDSGSSAAPANPVDQAYSYRAMQMRKDAICSEGKIDGIDIRSSPIVMQFCRDPLPIDWVIGSQEAAEQKIGTCGAACTSMTECGSSVEDNKCGICASQGGRPSMERLWSGFFCIASLAALRGTNSRLGARDLAAMNTMEDIVCPCNATYVSKGCCASSEGLVWEPPRMGLGRVDLKVDL